VAAANVCFDPKRTSGKRDCLYGHEYAGAGKQVRVTSSSRRDQLKAAYSLIEAAILARFRFKTVIVRISGMEVWR
jgi:hypothetical protein